MNYVIKNRYDFIMFFDVTDGNPNGDPDAGNIPRLDPETGHGMVTDVCLKRKIRNYVELAKAGTFGYDIFVKEKAILNRVIANAHRHVGGLGSDTGDKTDLARLYMCESFFDVRTFGAVMSTGKNAGQVRGPVQLTFARSVDRILPTMHCITRTSITTEAINSANSPHSSTIATKSTIPYALYRCHGFISPFLAERTGFGEDDLQLLWASLKNMFEVDRSAARGLMSLQKLLVFKHESKLGDCPAHILFDKVVVQNVKQPPRAFKDYKVSVPAQRTLPSGVTLITVL
jgi:CRISPR-associated protein Csd2